MREDVLGTGPALDSDTAVQMKDGREQNAEALRATPCRTPTYQLTRWCAFTKPRTHAPRNGEEFTAHPYPYPLGQHPSPSPPYIMSARGDLKTHRAHVSKLLVIPSYLEEPPPFFQTHTHTISHNTISVQKPRFAKKGKRSRDLGSQKKNTTMPAQQVNCPRLPPSFPNPLQTFKNSSNL